MKGKENLKPHDWNHLHNLSGPVGLQGRYKGTFYEHGIPRVSPKETGKKVFEHVVYVGELGHRERKIKK